MLNALDKREKENRNLRIIVQRKPNDCFSKINLFSKDTNIKSEVKCKQSEIMSIYDNNFIIYDGYRYKKPSLPNLDPTKDLNKNKSIRKLILSKHVLRDPKNDSFKEDEKSMKVTDIWSQRSIKNESFTDSYRKNTENNQTVTSHMISMNTMNTLKTTSTIDTTISVFSKLNPTSRNRLFKIKGINLNSDSRKNYETKSTKASKTTEKKYVSYLSNNSQKMMRNTRKKIYKGINNISDYNIKVSNKISCEKQNKTLNINKILRENLTENVILKPDEYQFLKLDMPLKKQILAEVRLEKGSNNYISQDKANLFKVCDSVWKMNDGSCYNFKKMVFTKYNEMAENTDQLVEYRYKRLMNEAPLKTDNINKKYCKIKYLKKSIYDTYRNALNIRQNFVSEKKDN
jgi:hypothetical protein